MVQTLCSPLQKNFNILEWADTKVPGIMNLINNPSYDHLRNKECEIKPPHKYKTYSAGMWKSNNDMILTKHECILDKDNHHHFYWTDHYTIPFNMFVQQKLYDDLNNSYV